MQMDKESRRKARGVLVSIALVGLALAVVFLKMESLQGESGTADFRPQIVGQSSYFRTIETAITTDLAEASASAFTSQTGVIQVAVVVNSGSATAGTITLYTKVAAADTVYTEVPSATFPLTASASKCSGRLNVGTGYHKLVVSSAAGTFNFDLAVRDF